jgi:hypothetical protein
VVSSAITANIVRRFILEIEGDVELSRGSGTFVKRGARSEAHDTRDLETFILDMLQTARQREHSSRELRGFIEAWLAAPPPGRVVAIDDALETAELMAHELRPALQVPVSACDLRRAKLNPKQLAGALLVTLPFHADRVRRLQQRVRVSVLALRLDTRYDDLVRGLGEGAMVLVVSHSERVLRYARIVVGSLRGEDVLLECRLLRDADEWRSLLPSADLIFADLLALPAVSRHRTGGVQPLVLLEKRAALEVREALATGASA